jgi:protein SMG6
VLHPMHTARASYAVQHDYKGQYAALPNLATAEHAAPPPAGGALDGMSPAAALVDSWRNKHAVVPADDPPPAELDSYPRTGRKSSSSSSSLPHRTPSTRSRRPPPPPPPSAGAASSFEQSAYGYPDPNQHRYLPPPPPSQSPSHHHLPPPPPRHPAAQQQQQQQQQQQRGQAHPSHAYQQASRYSAPAPSRSQPAAGSSNRTSRQQHRDRDRDRDRDRERQHHVPYDADYDRQLASPGQPNLGAAAAASSSAAAPAAAASRGLFDPRGGGMPSSSSSASKRHTASGGGSSSSPRRSQTGEGRSSRTPRHGSSATSTVHPPPPLPLPERGNPIPRPSSRAGDDRRPPTTRSKREPVQLADLGRRAGTTTTTTHHRGGGGGIPTPYDAKDSRESLESLGTDFSGRTKSSGGGGGGGRRRRRADAADGVAEDEGVFDPSGAAVGGGGGGGGGAGTGMTAGGGGGKNRQLFDPRKDDPMRFAVARPSAGVSSASQQQQQQQAPPPPAYASTAGFTGPTFTLQTESVMNLASPSGTAAAAADDASSIRTGASGHHDAHPSSSKRPDHPILAELKKAYRGILELEKKLQDEHRQATKEAERAAEDTAAANGSEGVQIQGQGKKYDDEYWVKLAKAHKQ